MQLLRIDHLFSHSLCAIIPSLVSKAALKEAFHNNNGEANTRSAIISNLNDVSFFVFLLPLHCLFTREVILYHVTVLILCSLTWVVVSTCTVLVKTFGTLCVSGGAIQIDPPPHLDSVGCYKSNTFYIIIILHTLRTTTLFRGEKPFQGLVYECVLRVSCKFHVKKQVKKSEVCQNLLARIVDSSF